MTRRLVADLAAGRIGMATSDLSNRGFLHDDS